MGHTRWTSPTIWPPHPAGQEPGPPSSSRHRRSRRALRVAGIAAWLAPASAAAGGLSDAPVVAAIRAHEALELVSEAPGAPVVTAWLPPDLARCGDGSGEVALRPTGRDPSWTVELEVCTGVAPAARAAFLEAVTSPGPTAGPPAAPFSWCPRSVVFGARDIWVVSVWCGGPEALHQRIVATLADGVGVPDAGGWVGLMGSQGGGLAGLRPSARPRRCADGP